MWMLKWNFVTKKVILPPSLCVSSAEMLEQNLDFWLDIQWCRSHAYGFDSWTRICCYLVKYPLMSFTALIHQRCCSRHTCIQRQGLHEIQKRPVFFGDIVFIFCHYFPNDNDKEFGLLRSLKFLTSILYSNCESKTKPRVKYQAHRLGPNRFTLSLWSPIPLQTGILLHPLLILIMPNSLLYKHGEVEQRGSKDQWQTLEQTLRTNTRK